MADKESNDILMSLQQLETRLQSERGTAESPGTIATAINEIKRILRGNGTPGLLIRLDRMEQWRHNVDTDAARIRSAQRIYLPSSISAVLAVLGFVAIQIWQQLLQH